ncbi:MAG: hypothetical protein V3T75_00920 [candidate division Zixibacteria bacterium]
MGIFKETLLEFFDRKQHLAGMAVTVLGLLLIYLGVSKRLELLEFSLETAANVTIFAIAALQTFVSLMVLLAAVSTIFLFTKLSRKAQVDYYLSKPITRGSFFFSKLFSIYFIYAIALTALSLMVGIELIGLGVITPEQFGYVLGVNLISFGIWMSVVMFVGMLTKSVTYCFASLAAVWVGQLVLKGRESWTAGEQFGSYLLDTIYYILPNTTEMGQMAQLLATGEAVSNWLPAMTSIVLLFVLIFTCKSRFHRLDF